MFPEEITEFDETTNNEVKRMFRGVRDGLCFAGPRKYVYPLSFMSEADGFYDAKLRNDDVWIVTFPRSGTTVTQEMVWQIRNNFQFDISPKMCLFDRSPFYEYGVLYISLNNYNEESTKFAERMNVPGYKMIEDVASPRTIKSHLPLSHLPKGLLDTCKVVYVARNPKDVAVSCFYHNQLLRSIDFRGTFSEYWDYFERNLVFFAPYWDHLREAWDNKDHKNMCFIFYEDFLKDSESVIKRICDFTGVIATHEQISGLKKHLQIDNFRKNVPVTFYNRKNMKGSWNETGQDFIRSGKVLSNKSEWTDELSRRADLWIEKHNKLHNIAFPV